VSGPIRAVLWDFGGVILDSPLDAFARFEAAHDLPEGLLVQIIATDPDTNAWACFERGEIDLAEFAARFGAEGAVHGVCVDATGFVADLIGAVRPAMVEAVRRCHRHLATALITNNFLVDGVTVDCADVLEHFDVVIESSRVGLRKPEPAIYRLALNQLGVEPIEAVFLDDLGTNLKPARAMGITTIKVTDPDAALAELEAIVGFPLR